MKLISLKASRYRSLESVELAFSQQYCTLSGRNNAGKSSTIKLLTNLFRQTHHARPFGPDSLEYQEDKCQWAPDGKTIDISYTLRLNRSDDPALVTFIERIADVSLKSENTDLTITYTCPPSDVVVVSIMLDGKAVAEVAAKEIDKRIKDSRLLFLYNSTTSNEEVYYGRTRRRGFYEVAMSEDERQILAESAKQTEKKLKTFAKKHTEQLSVMLGRLSERYDVELAPPEGLAIRRLPLGINLLDKHVKVPLDDWGSGTQNRTYILMAILQANRIRTTESSDDKITPIVVIEEPESFLHPTAQAEFGRMLRELSSECGIQIIATTHSPYMLNLEEPGANVLLTRSGTRGKAFPTTVVDTTGTNWMAPFSEHLGLGALDFGPLESLFASKKQRALLVEGPSDVEYFTFLQKNPLSCPPLRDDIDIVPYGGKDTLKNTVLLQFVLRTFDKVFITFDLDAKTDAETALGRLSYRPTTHFISLGVPQPGKDCIEGLLPHSVMSCVLGRETDLVMQLTSTNDNLRKQAKAQLKAHYLKEFTSRTDYPSDELKHLSAAITTINRSFD
jgi:putative ATP-dependent endonuclease of OLD family